MAERGEIGNLIQGIVNGKAPGAPGTGPAAAAPAAAGSLAGGGTPPGAAADPNKTPDQGKVNAPAPVVQRTVDINTGDPNVQSGGGDAGNNAAQNTGPAGQPAAGPAPAPAVEYNIENINSAPPEIQTFAKNLQADYTRKLQGIARDKNKIEAFNEIVVDPEIAAILARKAGLPGPAYVPAPGAPQAPGIDPSPTGEISLDGVDDNVKAIILKQQQQIGQLTGVLQTFQQDRVLQDIKSNPDYADIEEKLPELLPIMKAKKLSLTQAYDLQYGGDRQQKKEDELRNKIEQELSVKYGITIGSPPGPPDTPPNVGGINNPGAMSGPVIATVKDAISESIKRVRSGSAA